MTEATKIPETPEQLEQERKAADDLVARKREATRQASGDLDKAADLIRDYLIKAAEYQEEFGEEVPTISETAVCWKPAVPEVVLTATGENLPTISVSYPQGKELPVEGSDEEAEEETSIAE